MSEESNRELTQRICRIIGGASYPFVHNKAFDEVQVAIEATLEEKDREIERLKEKLVSVEHIRDRAEAETENGIK